MMSRQGQDILHDVSIGPRSKVDPKKVAEGLNKLLRDKRSVVVDSPDDLFEKEEKEKGVKDTGKKCSACGGAVVEEVWFEVTIDAMTPVGSRPPRQRQSIRYCQGCEILYR